MIFLHEVRQGAQRTMPNNHNCHSERSEESSRIFVGGCGDGFFTSFRMTRHEIMFNFAAFASLV